MRKIIDVSSAQGFINWQIVADQVDAVILKAADGMYEDQIQYGQHSYTENRIKADRYGVKVEAVYQWWYSPQQNINQTLDRMAKAMYRLAAGAKMCLDLELRAGVAWVPAWKTDIQNHLAALDQLGGRPTIAYIGLPMMQNLKQADGTWPAWLTARPLWFAQYPYRLPYGNRLLPKGEAFDQWNLNHRMFNAPTPPPTYPAKVWLWQFDGNGVLPGFQGNSVDLNYEINP